MSDRSQKRLVLSIIEFLQNSITAGQVKSDDVEGLEVAIQCIGEAFDVNPADDAQLAQLSIKPATLANIFDVFVKTHDKKKAASTDSKSVSKQDMDEADKLKTEGNTLMANKDHKAAIAKYGQAIAKNPNSPVYYSNRAAAHSQLGDHDSAIADAQKAAEIDPKFSKAYSRLGHAYYSSARYSESVKAYEKALELDPENATFKSSLATARSKVPSETTDNDSEDDDVAAPAGGMPDLSALRGMMGGGAGGMPDFASMMNNPAFMQMAQNMMANGGMERMMANPQIRQMAEQMGRGGGMPDLSSLAGLMGGLGGQGQGQGGQGQGRGSGRQANQNSDMYS